MSVAAIIPARYASTRFPGKPLASATGKPMIQHVYEAVRGARRLDRVIVATDDERIASAVRGFGGEVEMTRPDHATGTDRVAEVAGRLDVDLVVNVQGDEPEMDPRSIDTLVELMASRPDAPMGSLCCRFAREEDVLNPACVKVVLDARGNALYFSRSLIPYPRDAGGRVDLPGRWLLHLGIYAYRPAFLKRLTATPPTELERIEQLEQLRVLYMGERIAMAVVERHSTGIDTPGQYAAFVERYKKAQTAKTQGPGAEKTG
ncbi:MAG TPA: 3-deoxy-manno-octulosonate cytidylyltransferase [Phycisphaerae bacterium]|nr:3-deoxy-manno-octulosonate cytidylyltransferase [Phycisphaerae bacterium]HOJ55846.1 3-deoxy-manno-octulosonate cytidylyltransferase [Phycisphaerae bacterium]HOL27819.1 3-deoxy-manno-octulosonate cytidylyltransferase [Phycisphaerae bacterium]HPP22252.1 3-deoxy-manno-octulosonate cytidylyltransferase [Phycisphaerae bacterium]HPU34295.1 3-deoxy-manno-octulosonate cytidylyltransferase [Phycisphaerae bacterium]